MKLIVLALAAGTAVAECPNVSSSVATKAGQRKAAARERPARGSPRPAGGSPRHPRTCPKTRSHEKPRPRLCAHRSCRAGRRRTHKTHEPHERDTAPRRERAERDPQNNTGLLRPRHLRHVRRVHLLPELAGGRLLRADLPLRAGARRHAQGRPRRLRRRAERHGHDRHRRLDRLPPRHDRAVPAHGRLGGWVSHEHGPRLRRVRQQGHLRPQVRRVRLLPGLLGRGLPEGGLRRRDVLGPRRLHERAGPGRRGPRQRLQPPATRARRASPRCASTVWIPSTSTTIT